MHRRACAHRPLAAPATESRRARGPIYPREFGRCDDLRRSSTLCRFAPTIRRISLARCRRARLCIEIVAIERLALCANGPLQLRESVVCGSARARVRIAQEIPAKHDLRAPGARRRIEHNLGPPSISRSNTCCRFTPTPSSIRWVRSRMWEAISRARSRALRPECRRRLWWGSMSSGSSCLAKRDFEEVVGGTGLEPVTPAV
jgi:hypothetical protein